jgi:phenol hydroxylase P0 protein
MNHTTPAVSPQGLACHAPAFEVTSVPSPIPTGTEAAACDIAHKFVRVKEVRADGLVCFEFAIGWPELFVDLMLPQAAFDEFCSRQQVQRLTD